PEELHDPLRSEPAGERLLSDEAGRDGGDHAEHAMRDVGASATGRRDGGGDRARAIAEDRTQHLPGLVLLGHHPEWLRRATLRGCVVDHPPDHGRTRGLYRAVHLLRGSAGVAADGAEHPWRNVTGDGIDEVRGHGLTS